MGLHSDLDVYKAAYDLLKYVAEVTRNIPRDFKRQFGEKLRDECTEIAVLIFRANVADNKTPHLKQLLERLQVVELLIRLMMDLRFIGHKQFAQLVELTASVGKQTTGWKNWSENQSTPATRPPGQSSLCV